MAQNRIIGLEYMPANQLLANPLNARRHPAKQREALRGSLDTLGYYDAVIMNQRTGYLIDGHARVEEQLTADENATMPVLVVDMSEEEEAQALASHDWITQLAVYDNQILDDLLREFNSDDDRVQAMVAEMADDLGLIESLDNDISFDVETQLKRGDVPDALFPSDNEFDIPLLDINMQADFLDLPFNLWGFVKRKQTLAGTIAFYVDDYRFDAVWSNPQQIINTSCVSVVEPNYSTNNDMPLAIGLWGIYRKRWLARYWQTYGVKTFVDLNVDNKFEKYALLGVPYGWKSYCTRGYSDYIENTETQYEMAKERAGTEPLFVVYGGGEKVQAHCKARGWIWIMEVMTQKRQEQQHGRA